jgi:hypothetical protein
MYDRLRDDDDDDDDDCGGDNTSSAKENQSRIPLQMLIHLTFFQWRC